jgi:hypothetical protein
VAGIDGAAQYHRVVAVDGADLLGFQNGRVHALVAEDIRDRLGDLARRAMLGRRRHEYPHCALR